jgi:hypothetical protein
LRVTPLLLVLGSGCALLTPAQVQSVNQLAGATKKYVSLPPKVVDVYGDAHARRELLLGVSTKYGTPELAAQGLSHVQRAVERRSQIDARAKGLREALAVLQAYADALEALTSDKLTELDDTLEGMGRSIDDNVAAYNQAKGAQLQSFGGVAAAAARAAGGVFFKLAQHRYLEQYVVRADPVVQALVRDVIDLLGNYTGPDNVLAAEADAIGDTFKIAGVKPEVGYDEARGYYRALQLCASGQKLAAQAIAASKSFAEGHSKLKESVEQKLSLTGTIAQITVMAGQVQAAMEVKKAIEEEE